ncbi:aminopeptidase M1-A-like [Nylanderia fulva]|uniref:aminopeptidase M1-A-like n=1 Tax=Nylanderia fulva TaxID=613905 RepID=UPI0010FB4A50|nr:aminopeptidase M1-A-like [Nylanderia fulva]
MMICLKLLLSSGLMFIAETAFVLNESSLCYQPSKYIKPIHYDIKHISHIERNIFCGEYNISISILNKTQHILLHSEKLSIKDIVLFTNVEKNHENDKDTVYKPTYNTTEDDTIDIIFKDKLSPGNFTLNIKYYGIADEVFTIFKMKEKTALVGVTHFHIIGARRLSSCWGHQNLLLEATFNISVGCHDQCTALSNMPLRNTEKNKCNNISWTHFDTTPAMSPYFATIIVSNYLSRVDNNTQNIQMWCRNETVFHMEFAKNVAENITLFYKNKWKQHSNSISKVTHVAIPNFPDNGIIVFGLVLYKETDIIYDKNLYSNAHKIKIAELVGHKVTQQWFYNLNNPFRSASWLHKAFTTLLATYAVNEMYPDNRTINLFVVQNQHTSFYLDNDYRIWNSVSQDDSLFKIRESIRAPFILRMMQHAFEDTFWKPICSYANSTLSHRLGPVNLMKDVALKMDFALKLTRIEYWVSKKHCPLIKVERNYSDLMSQTIVSTCQRILKYSSHFKRMIG